MQECGARQVYSCVVPARSHFPDLSGDVHATEAVLHAAAPVEEDWWPNDDIAAPMQQQPLDCQAADAREYTDDNAHALSFDAECSAQLEADPAHPFSSRSSSPQPACSDQQPSHLGPQPSCMSSQHSAQALPEPSLLHNSLGAPLGPDSLVQSTALQDQALQQQQQNTAAAAPLGSASAEQVQAILAAAASCQEASMSEESDSDYDSEDLEGAVCCVNCTSRLYDEFCEVRVPVTQLGASAKCTGWQTSPFWFLRRAAVCCCSGCCVGS